MKTLVIEFSSRDDLRHFTKYVDRAKSQDGTVTGVYAGLVCSALKRSTIDPKNELQPETVKAISKLSPDCVDSHSMRLGINGNEPLLVAIDGLLRYAKAYASRFGSKLCDDGVLGHYWLDGIKGIHGLLNGDGVVAMEKNITTDSKSNGVIEDVYCEALSAAGFTRD